MGGTFAGQRRDRDGKDGGGLPQEHGDGVLQLGPLHAEINRLGLGGFDLSFGLHHVALGGDTHGVTVFGQIENLLVGGDRVIKELLLRIQGAQEKIVLGQGGLGAQPRHFQVGGEGLGAGLAGLHAAADLAPDIQFPGGVEVEEVVR